MHIITTTTGARITLDGDLLAIMETLYREVTAKRELERSFEDIVQEIQHLIEQMDDSERRAYLAEIAVMMDDRKQRLGQHAARSRLRG